MLRRGRWKLVFFSEGNPPLLFDIETDPREMTDLADDPAHASTLQDLIGQLREILDPEEVNRQAFAAQARMIERLGGIDTIMAMPSFNHTPLD
jgi:choline-sulfatase